MAEPAEPRPSSPSLASVASDDEPVLVTTPTISEADSLSDYLELSLTAAQAADTLPAYQHPSVEDSTDSTSQSYHSVHNDEPPTYAESSIHSSNAPLYEPGPADTRAEGDIKQHYDPEKTEALNGEYEHDAPMPGTFTYDDSNAPDPPEEAPEASSSTHHQNTSNPFLATATAAISLSTLLALFATRTIYNGASAATSTLFTNLQSDFRATQGDFATAVTELRTALGDAGREANEVRTEVHRAGSNAFREAGGIAREARERVRDDVEEVVRDLQRVRGEVVGVVGEVGREVARDFQGAVGEIRDILGQFRGLL